MWACAAGNRTVGNTDPHLGRGSGESDTLTSEHYGSHLITDQATPFAAVLGQVGLPPLCQTFLPEDHTQSPHEDPEAIFLGNA